jgi:hypothetical protein
MLTRVLAVGAGPIASAMDIDGCGAGCGAGCVGCGAGVAGAGVARALGGGVAFAAAPREGASAMPTGASGTPRVDAAPLSGFVVGEASAAATESESGSAVMGRAGSGTPVAPPAAAARATGLPTSPADADWVDDGTVLRVESDRPSTAVATTPSAMRPISPAAASPICRREKAMRRGGGTSSSSPGVK